VRGIDGASWNNERFDFVTFTFQVRMHLVECHVDDASNILTNDPTRLGLAYDSEHFRPEVAVIILASSLPGNGEWLAGESSCEKSDSCVYVASYLAYVFVDRDFRPVFFEDGLGVGFAVAEPNSSVSVPSCGQGKSTDPAE